MRKGRSEFVELYLDDALRFIAAKTINLNGRRLDFRADAGESSFLEEQLRFIESTVYDYKLRELKFRVVFPVSNEGEGSAQIAYDLVRGVGVAKIIASGATDIPRADTFVKRYYAIVRAMALGFGYTTQEMRNASFANVPLDAQRASSVRRGFEEKFNEIAFQGDATHNILGLLNNTNVPVVQVAAPATGTSRVWGGADKTKEEIIKDVSSALSDVVDDTNQVHTPDSIGLPISKYEYLRKTPYSTQAPISLLRYLLDPLNGYDIKRITQLPELKTAGPGGEACMWVYEMSDEVMTFRIPMEPRPMPPEQRGLEFVINMEAEIAGLVIRRPLAMSITYGI